MIKEEFSIRKGRKSDCSAVLDLIHELAAFEKAAEEVDIDIQTLQNDGFGEKPRFELLVAEIAGKIVGMALFYERYSTWKGASLYLEDLIVKEKERGKGIGKALFEAVIQKAKERDSGRMEWQVLDWNQPAINFYDKYGADYESEWLNGSFTKEKLASIKI